MKATGDFLSSCPTKHYLLVSQPNLNIEHLNSKTAAPKLQSALSSSKVQGRMMVSEMSGVVDLQQVASSIRESCQAAGKTPSIDSMVLDAVPTAGRYEDLVENLVDSDNDVGVVLQQYDAAGDFTVIYTAGARTDKAEEKHYEAEFKDTTHQELKRQVDSVKREKKERDTRPLFEKYQFFTPGTFICNPPKGRSIMLNSMLTCRRYLYDSGFSLDSVLDFGSRNQRSWQPAGSVRCF